MRNGKQEKKKTQRQEMGREAEAAAAAFLQNKGFQVLDANWRTREGELDLVCRDGGCLVFVEVKSGAPSAWQPADRINFRKQTRLRRAAEQYLATHDGSHDSIRFDAVLMTRSRDGEWKIEHIRNAF